MEQVRKYSNLQNDKKALFEDNIQAKAQASLAQQALTSGADILSALRSSRHGWGSQVDAATSALQSITQSTLCNYYFSC